MRIKREPTQIKDLLDQTIGRLGIKRALKQSEAVLIWPEVVGEKVALKSQAIKIIDGILYVKAASPAWSQQLSLMSEQFKQKINEKLGKTIVKQIKFHS